MSRTVFIAWWKNLKILASRKGREDELETEELRVFKELIMKRTKELESHRRTK
jgi:hypothetical protein